MLDLLSVSGIIASDCCTQAVINSLILAVVVLNGGELKIENIEYRRKEEHSLMNLTLF